MTAIIGLKLFFTGLVLVALGYTCSNGVRQASAWYVLLQLFGGSSVAMTVVGAIIFIWGF